MKRPTRVPASSVVRMNIASNMMAKWYHIASSALAEGAAEDAGHADRQRGRAAGAGEQRRLAHLLRQLLHLLHRDREAPGGNGRHRGLAASSPTTPGRAVDGEVHAGVEHAWRRSSP